MTGASELDRGERTREAILNAAEGLILSQGYHGTSMRQIADKAGIAVSGIYNHYEGKEAIFSALLQRHQPYTDITDGLSDLSGESVSQLIEKAARRIVDRVMADPVFIRLAFIDLQEFEGDTLFKFATHMIQGMVAFVGRLVDSGKVRQDLPLPVLVRSFAGMIGFFVLTEAVAFDADTARLEFPFDAEIDWVGGIVDIYLNGVLDKTDV